MSRRGRKTGLFRSLMDLSPEVRRVLGTQEALSKYLLSQGIQAPFQSPSGDVTVQFTGGDWIGAV